MAAGCRRAGRYAHPSHPNATTCATACSIAHPGHCTTATQCQRYLHRHYTGRHVHRHASGCASQGVNQQHAHRQCAYGSQRYQCCPPAAPARRVARRCSFACACTRACTTTACCARSST